MRRTTFDHHLVRLAAAATVAVVTVGCSSEEGPSAERFCGEVDVNAQALTAPDLSNENDIEPLLELYRDIGALAPLSIETEWTQLVSAYETASTVVPGDAASEQVAVAAAFSIEKSAVQIDSWLTANCAVDIGPVFTIVAQDG